MTCTYLIAYMSTVRIMLGRNQAAQAEHELKATVLARVISLRYIAAAYMYCREYLEGFC